jgi:hypothetical protein
MHLRLSKLGREEEGFALIPTLGAIALVTVLVAVSLAAANGDVHLVQRDLDTKRAYAAAQAGVIDYAFHLNSDANYWARCTGTQANPLPTPNAVNQVGSTAHRRTVPGSTDGSQYAIELLPATTYTGSPNQCDPTNPVDSMLEKSGPNAGTFRIRATGYEGTAKRSIVATFRQSSFLDYVYFTQLETSDPVTYGFLNPSAALDGAYSQCTKFRRDGRESVQIPGTGIGNIPRTFCDQIVFASGDNIKGPMHTNDDFCLAQNSNPTFGRSAADPIEVSASSPGWHTSTNNACTGTNASPNFAGSLVPNAAILLPKPIETSNLQTLAGPTYTYTGQTTIELSGSSMRINGGASVPVPTGGVLYIKNGSCSTTYSPFTATYPATSGCGNAIVHSSSPYASQLTIAAENDIIIDGSIQRDSNASGLLGLVAGNFIRVKHLLCPSATPNCDGSTSVETAKGICGTAVNGTTPPNPLNNLQIDAALLAIDHSFIVDHYDCGPSLGNLNVTGAIAQKFRGAVGTSSGNTGYLKNYVYDDHLRFEEPPEGFDPTNKSWHVGRETLDFP